MRARSFWGMALAGSSIVPVVAVVLAGCGTKFDLPTQSPGGVIPGDGSYHMEASWTGMNGIQDILLTPAGQLFLLFRHSDTGPAPRGEVRAYGRLARTDSVPPPLVGYPFRTLFNPVALCDGGTSVFVLDQGDTCEARRNPATGSCDSTGGWTTDITDLSKYWRVREYDLVGTGGTGTLDTISTFTDTSFAFVQGIAADAQGNVYVAGVAIVNVPDQEDARILTRSLVQRVYRYARGAAGDENMPGANWHRDKSWLVEDGAGTGFITDVRGIFLGTEYGAPKLFVADIGDKSVQRLDVTIANVGQKTGGLQSDDFLAPVDVAADLAEFFYVADPSYQRVLRYAPDGSLVQRVDIEPDAIGRKLLLPVTVAADSELVFVGDRGRSEVIRYRRRK